MREKDGPRPAPHLWCLLCWLGCLGGRVLLVRDDLVDAAGGEHRHREGLALLEGIDDLLWWMKSRCCGGVECIITRDTTNPPTDATNRPPANQPINHPPTPPTAILTKHPN